MPTQTQTAVTDRYTVASESYSSRLLLGTGKYKDLDETRRAVEASGAEIVTIAVRRTNIGQTPGKPNILEVLPPERYTILPNTAGCFDAETAIRTCRLARELLDGHNLCKLEVLGTKKPCSQTWSLPSRRRKYWSRTASTLWSTPTTTPS